MSLIEQHHIVPPNIILIVFFCTTDTLGFNTCRQASGCTPVTTPNTTAKKNALLTLSLERSSRLSVNA